jgi:hypothetical protein
MADTWAASWAAGWATAELRRVGPHGYIHGWIKVGAAGTGLDAKVREANAARAKTGILKRGQRQNMSIGAGLGVAGGSSDIERPIADALTQAARSGREHYVIPTAYGMAASSHKVNTSGYIKVTPQGEVTDWRREHAFEEHRHVATLSDHTVAAILERHLSKTQTYTAPVKTAKKDPEIVPRAVVARLIKDIQKTPALQKKQFYDKARQIAAKSGALDLIPAAWG